MTCTSMPFALSTPVWKSKFYDAFVLNHSVVLHAIDATPARWLGDADSSPLDGTSAATPSPRHDLVKTHWLISTQVPRLVLSRPRAVEALAHYARDVPDLQHFAAVLSRVGERRPFGAFARPHRLFT